MTTGAMWPPLEGTLQLLCVRLSQLQVIGVPHIAHISPVGWEVKVWLSKQLCNGFKEGLGVHNNDIMCMWHKTGST